MSENENKRLAEVLKEICDSLTDEQKKKAKACKNEEELLKLAAQEGIELPDEIMDAITGGYIYYHKDNAPNIAWEIIDDKTGKTVNLRSNAHDAAGAAGAAGLSTKEITWDEVKKLRKDYEDSLKDGC
ncbi:MAG: hypothetical protein IJV00_09170 [Clostridia bacterium]|nr:hypothetical protein [Clostridia bacterium]